MRDTHKRAAVMAVLAVALVAAWGCRRRGVVTGGLSARDHTRLMHHAQRDTGCPAAQLSPSLISSPPNVYTVTGCAQPQEYWQECRGRRCRWHRVQPLHESASGLLSCPPQMVQQQLTQQPSMRTAVGCGRMVTFAMACTGSACAWSPASPVQAQGAAVTAAPQPQAQQQVTVASPPAQGNPSAALQAQVQQQREAVLSCVDPGTTLVLSLRWTADGQVIVQLPDNLAGTAAEGCIQAALGALQVAAQQPGTIEVPLSQ